MNAFITREAFIFTFFRREFHSTLKLELCRHECRRRDPIISTCRYGKNMPTTALVQGDFFCGVLGDIFCRVRGDFFCGMQGASCGLREGGLSEWWASLIVQRLVMHYDSAYSNMYDYLRDAGCSLA